MITWYADIVNADFTDPNLWNRFLEQHIDSGPTQHFTTHPQIDSSIFKFCKQNHQFKTFANYEAGHNVVIIGLHGGWTNEKLKHIANWFTSSAERLLAWRDPNCQIIIDYSEEGFTTEVFEDFWHWITEHNLDNRVLYVSSSCNVEELYNRWCQQNRMHSNMIAVWYGFFATWLLRDRIMCQIESDLPAVKYTGGARFMCLNRRPHPHRILLLSLLERYNLIDAGAVSMPKHFDEVEIDWETQMWDIRYQWLMLKDRFNGYVDALESNFQNMYAKLPLIADTDNFAFNYALDINGSYYQNFPINVISETLFFSEATFASEKIWKPMMIGQIFIVMAAPGYLQSLRNLGFKTFSPAVDEEYDLMTDPVERAVAVAKSLKKLVSLDQTEFDTVLQQCAPIIEHNRSLLNNRKNMEQLISRCLVKQIEQFWDQTNT